jgi:predicted membrane channel-forming protein YqfA (hemolysin III family)
MDVLTCHLGPILGGVITQTSTWRWVYLFNAPCAVIGILGCIFALPKTHHSNRSSTVSLKAIRTIDYLGGFLLLAASTLLVFALQEAGSVAFAWDSAAIIVALTIAGVSWIGFFARLWWLEFGQKATNPVRPIVPLRVLFSRPTGPAIV